MSQHPFHFINSGLCFDEKSTPIFRIETDNLATIRQVFESFVDNCPKNYGIGEYVTVDEMLVAFIGNAKFRHYTPSKRQQKDF